jgi:hypothetical protein
MLPLCWRRAEVDSVPAHSRRMPRSIEGQLVGAVRLSRCRLPSGGQGLQEGDHVINLPVGESKMARFLVIHGYRRLKSGPGMKLETQVKLTSSWINTLQAHLFHLQSMTQQRRSCQANHNPPRDSHISLVLTPNNRTFALQGAENLPYPSIYDSLLLGHHRRDNLHKKAPFV